ncbi:MAG: choice-of-anchor J domain-containing protein [Flavobacteriales bacterium]
MKISRLWILPILFLLGKETKGQTLNEGFENDFPPSDWTILNYGDNNTFEESSSSIAAHSGSKTAKIQYSTSAHDDWIITPKLSVSSTTDTIHFWAKNHSPSFLEDFHVKVSTNGQDTASFTQNLATHESPSTVWQKYSYSLHSYVGQDIYVAIQAISTNEYALYLDDFSGPDLFQPTCQKVDSISITAMTSETAMVLWPEVNGAQNYLCQIFEQGGSPYNSIPIFEYTSSSTSVEATGLSGSTMYDVYIKTICSGSDSSEYKWKSFETICAPYSMLEETFEIVNAEGLPNCWFAINNANSSYGSVKAVTYTNPAFGAKHLRLYNGSSSSAKQFAITPNLPDLANGTHRLRFMAKNGASEKLVVGTFGDPNNEATFTPIDTLELTNSEVEYIINFNTNYSDQFIGFHLLASSSYQKIFIDELHWEPIPSCVQPSEINLLSSTTTDLIINWDNFSGASDFIIEYGLNDFVLGSGSSTVSTSSEITLTSLLAGTTYDVYVKAVCSSSDSSIWSNVVTFTTLCEESSEVQENFETTALNTLPNCWNSIVNSTTGSPYIKIVNTGSPANGSQQISLYNSSAGSDVELILIAPLLNSIGNKRIKFYARGGGQMKIGSISNPNDISTFSPLDSVNIVTINNEYEFILDASIAGQYLAFKAEPNTSYTYTYLDSIRITELPTCIEPNNLISSIVSQTEVELGWSTIGSENEWIIEYGSVGFIQGTGQSIVTSSNPSIISDLTYGDTVQFYVRGICSTADTSAYSSGVTQILECAPETSTFSEDFSTFLPNCWSLAKGELTSNSLLEPVTGTGSWDWKEDGYLNNGFTGAARLNIYGTGSKHWLISPSIELENTHTKKIEFKTGLTDFNNGNAPESGNFGNDDFVKVVISLDNGLTWSEDNTLIVFDTNNVPSHSGELITIDLASYTGIVKIGFYGESTESNEDNDFFIDDFALIENSSNVDLGIENIEIDSVYCFNEVISPSIEIKNHGDILVSSYSIDIELTGPNSYSNSINYAQNLDVDSVISIPLNVFTGLLAGVYELTIEISTLNDTIVSNNTQTISFTIEEVETIVLNSDLTICEGDSVQLLAFGSNHLIWNGNISNETFVSPSSTTEYSVLSTSANGCEQEHSFTVTVDPLPNFSIQFNNNVLSTNVLFSSYSWTLNGVQVSSLSSFSPNENGTYILDVLNNNGCLGSEEYIVNGLSVNQSLVEVNIYPNPVVNEVNINLIDGTEVSIWSLDGKLIKEVCLLNGKINLTNLDSGVYFIQVKNSSDLFKITKL